MPKREKRTKGTGSVYQDKRQPSRWIAQYHDGERYHRRYTPDRESAQEALQELIKLHKQDQIKLTGARQTLDDFVGVIWDSVIVHKGLAPKTLDDYKATIGRYLLPDWGNVRLEKFDVQLCVQIFYALQREYSASIAHRALTKLSMILDIAERWKFISLNPVPRARKDLPANTHRDPQPLSPAQTRTLLSVVDGHRLSSLYHVALTLGLRQGELLGLQWTDIDFDAATLTIRRQVQDVGGKVQVRQRTKTQAGARTLPIPPRLLDRLRAYRANALDSVFLFPADTGTTMRPSNFARHWRIMRARAGLQETHFHDLRHTCATRLMEQGVAEVVIAAILGHGKRGITQRYTTATESALRRAIEEHETALLRAA